jgi:hypothetical protein
MSFRGGPSPRAYDPDREFLSLDGAAERPDEFVTDVDDATEQTLRSVSR